MWELPTATGSYRVGLAPGDLGPVALGWGDPDEPLPALPTATGWDMPADVLPLEYAVLGTRQRQTAELIIDQGDGLVGARLVWEADGELIESGAATTLVLRGLDTTGRIELELRIATSRDHDVVAKRVMITNVGRRKITLSRAFAPAWDLPMPEPAELGFLAGDWSAEFTPHRITLPAGTFSIGSRQGVTSASYSPVISIASPEGSAYGMALAWSGSWRLAAEAVPLRAGSGSRPGSTTSRCVITLDPGEAYTTPETLGSARRKGSKACPAAGTTTSAGCSAATSDSIIARSSTTPGTRPSSTSSRSTRPGSPTSRQRSAPRCSWSTTAGSPAGPTTGPGWATGPRIRSNSRTGSAR